MNNTNLKQTIGLDKQLMSYNILIQSIFVLIVLVIILLVIYVISICILFIFSML